MITRTGMIAIGAATALVAVLAVIAAIAMLGEEAPSFAGRWNVQYQDIDIGIVSGTARVDADERAAEVVLVHPRTKGEYRLTATSIERTRDGVVLLLSGDSPRSSGALPFQLGEPIDVPSGSSALAITLGDTKLSVPVKEPRAPDDKIRLELSWVGQRALSGTWSFRARADTARGSGGFGRAGAVVLSNDGSGLAIVSHGEIWVRPHTTIEHVFVVQDQTNLTLGTPAWSYPFDDRGKETGTAMIDRTRTLLVLGRNLPSRRTDKPTFTSSDPKLEYGVRAVAEDIAKVADYKSEIERIWERLEERGIPQTEINRFKSFEAMLITVRADAGILPGAKSFTLDDARADWLLEFGDFIADLRVVRPLLKAGTVEQISYAFRPERIQFEIEARRELPYDEIPLLVALNRQIRTLDGKREIMARRVAGNPKLYRTAEILLYSATRPPPGANDVWKLPVAFGDEIATALAVPGLVRFVPSMASVHVVQSPGMVPAYRLGPSAQLGLSWHSALSEARECKCREYWSMRGARYKERSFPAICRGTIDYDAIPRQEADDLWNVIIFTGGKHVRGVTISVGEHALMLMLRDTFKDLMLSSEAAYREIAADPQRVRGYRRAYAPDLAKPQAIDRIQVKLPNGQQAPFWLTFDDKLLDERLGLRGTARKRWIEASTREALLAFADQIKGAREYASSIKSCAVEDMLQLTGNGFGAISTNLAPRLMFYDRKTELWRPDPAPRSWLAAFHGKADQVFEQRAAAQADNQAILFVLSLATTGGAAGGAFFFGSTSLTTGLALFANVLDLVDLGYTSWSEISQQWAEHDELKFARGATAVLGMGRLEVAEERDRNVILSAFQITMSALGVAQGVADPVMHAINARAIEHGNQLAARFPPGGGGGAGLAERITQELPVPDRIELAAALIEARRLAREMGPDALTTAERRSLALAEELAKTQEMPRGAKPPWAERLSDSLYEEVRPMAARRPDVPQLFSEDAIQMGRNLAAVDGVQLLKGTPFLEVDAFTRALEKARRRQPSPPGFFAATAPNEPDPPGVFVQSVIDPAGKVQLFATRGADHNDNIAFVVMARGADERVSQPMLIMDTVKNYPHGSPKQPGFDPTSVLNDPFAAPKNAAKPDLRWVRTRVDMIPGRGTPISYYLSLRAIQTLGFKYADAALKTVKLQTILNAETRAEFLWLTRAYPDEKIDDLFRHTEVFRYAEGVLHEAGYSIDGVNVALDTKLGLPKTGANLEEPVLARPIGGAVRDGSPWYASNEPAAHFLKRYNLDPQDLAEAGFDVYLTVRPASH